ncbi:cell division initiation protein [Streptomyces sp. PTM05]|uniref:Cell division initiation protein n=1 Tax=Streptantibioticus parmotrematis TaxID=2873249 RepID=A0ABS7R010_9ACTN|nr:cell division initiation protein [Streptantibioticus parmotrematis]MBY8888807.1 cell division initiation protein [Streptantibioticus parmotrematis]
MDVQKKLDEIVAAVEGARSMPMSASCVVNRAELVARLSELRDALPDSLSQAQALLGDRDQMVAEARAEAERIIESAHQHRGSLVSDTEVARQSQEEADRILAEARREAEEIRAESDEYVDSKLANFEVVLTKTLGSVDRGREKLLGRDPGAPQDDVDDEAPERSADPEELRRRADAYVDAKLGAFEAVLAKTLEAVGRGRQKLTGHRAIDDLGAHLAAQDAAEGGAAHQSDAEYLAGLAGVPFVSEDQAAQAAQAVQVPQADPGTGYGYPEQPQQQPYDPAAAYPAAAAAQPGAEYGYQQDGWTQQQPGYDGYGYPQQPQQQPEYGTEYADPAAYGWQEQPQGYDQPHVPHQQSPYEQQAHQPHDHQPHDHQAHQGHQAPQPAGLDETSFFDTGMIDLDRLRELEQGR